MSRDEFCIFEDENVCVIDGKGPGKIVVVFNPITHLYDGTGEFWGKVFLKSRGFHPVGIVSKSINWFPVSSTRRAVEALKAAGFQPSWIYGYSQGGYGALKYSAALGAPAIALAPQFTIDPSVTGEHVNRDYHGFFDPEINADMTIRDGDVFAGSRIIYDPGWTNDEWNAAKIMECSQSELVQVPACGHDVPQLLIQTRAVDVLFSMSAAGFGQFVWRNRFKAPLYRLTKARRERDMRQHYPAIAWYLLAALAPKSWREAAMGELKVMLAERRR